MRRTLWTVVGALCAVALLLGMMPGAALAHKDKEFASEISLPNGWQPEGIIIGDGPVIYSGSLANGAIYAANLKTGQGKVLVPAQAGRSLVGLNYDPRTKYIYAAGGSAGKAFVFDARTGATVAEITLTTGPSFINDLVITKDAVYFTNSFAPEYYRVALGKGGALKAGTTAQTIALGSGFDFIPGGFNANGIEASKDGKYLIIVNSTSGKLYRVQARSGATKALDLGGQSVSFGDGLRLDGDTLYVVRNQLNQVAVFDLAENLLSGKLERTLSDPRLDVPTTADTFGKGLYVVNARFNTPPTADTTYSIVRIEVED